MLSTRAFRAHAQLSQPVKTKKGPPSGDPSLFLVEAAGVVSSLSLDRPSLRFGHPRHAGADSVLCQIPQMQKGRPFRITPFTFGGGGGS